MPIPDYRNSQCSNELYHYGMPRRSGRYPWGSGERPYQSQTIGGYVVKGVKSGVGRAVKGTKNVVGRVSKGVKSGYDKVPPSVKTAGRIGGKVAASLLISNALGIVGGRIVYSTLAPAIPIGGVKGFGNILAMAKQIDEAKEISLKTYAGITTAISLGSIGRIKIDPNNDKK